jgi:hypothetical protein
MPTMNELNQEIPNKLGIEEMEHNGDKIKQSIEQIIEINKEVLNKFFYKTSKVGRCL